MSTLKVNNLQDINGANNSTPEQVAQGRAKAWVRFDGSGTVSITDSFNISSMTDVATGRYSFDFTNNMANANYVVITSTVEDSDGGSDPNEYTTSTFRVFVTDDGNFTDRDIIHAVVFGDQ
tara:strand:- start:140 stop:502 length:363 start_codon:yes stop_codon:yes gene_type:complete